MYPVFVASDNIITSLGMTTDDNLQQIRNNITGIRLFSDSLLHPLPYYASLIDNKLLEERFDLLLKPEYQKQKVSFTRFEKLLIISVTEALAQINLNPSSKDTLVILSTTKGNIELLEGHKKNSFDTQKLFLWKTANLLQEYLKNPNSTVVISNACISGLLAIMTGVRMIKAGLYNNVIVAGCDILSEFIVSGFQSFQSLENGPCKPFDATRNGLSLGEGAGTIVLTSNRELATGDAIVVKSGASANDANHISGPSRTGEGLYIAIQKTLQEGKITASGIDFISAHGTGTPYNDEMETQAICRSGLINAPVNSLKGYFGHTLGAAGVIESIIGIHSVLNNELYHTLGYNELGVTEKINVINGLQKKNIHNCLKLASGFGGCNAAVLFERYAGN
jgi:3-oxoacyl-[acyl-carrier-protein] synthase I